MKTKFVTEEKPKQYLIDRRSVSLGREIADIENNRVNNFQRQDLRNMVFLMLGVTAICVLAVAGMIFLMQ